MLKRFRAKANHQQRTYTIRQYDENGCLVIKYRSLPQDYVNDCWEYTNDADVQRFIQAGECYIIKQYAPTNPHKPRRITKLKPKATLKISVNHQQKRFTIRAYDENGYLYAKYRSLPQTSIAGCWTQAKIRKLLRSGACYLVQTYENSTQKIK